MLGRVRVRVRMRARMLMRGRRNGGSSTDGLHVRLVIDEIDG